jgi:hypothetical protein
VGRGVHVGGHVRWLRDASSGAGGVSVLGQGPASLLASYNGAFRFPIPDDAERYRSQIVWTGADASWNPLLTSGRLGASAYVVGNFGRVATQDPMDRDRFVTLAKVAGVAANARVAFRWGRTPRDMVSLDGMYTSGDPDGITDGTYRGVITGNTWGAPGALWVSHGAYLLMPHSYVVNRFYAAVTDPSNLGFGVSAATLNASVDVVPNLLEVKVGGAVARSNIKPIAGDNFIGAELNGRVSWRLRPLLALEAHAAWLSLGGYFESPEIVEPLEGFDPQAPVPGPRPQNPWTAFLSLRWLII